MRTAHLFMTLLFLAVVGSVSAAPGNTLTVTTANHTITASGLTPGQTAVFYGVAQVAVPHRYLNRVQRWAVTVNDNGGTGTVTFDLQQDIPPASVWAVVDASNGNYGTVSGPGVGLREMATVGSGLALRAGAGTLVDHFAFDRGYLDLLYVSPGNAGTSGVGSWTWSAVGGSTADNGLPNSSTVVPLVDGLPVAQAGSASPPPSPIPPRPSAFVAGGLLVAIDFNRLEIAVVPIDQQLLTGATQ